MCDSGIFRPILVYFTNYCPQNGLKLKKVIKSQSSWETLIISKGFGITCADCQGPLEEQIWLYNGGSGGSPLPYRAPKPKSHSQGRGKAKFVVK